MANDYFDSSSNFKVIGGILSPVSNGYGKPSLISPKHRLAMCKLASEAHPFITVEPWETLKSDWTPTLDVLKHFDEEIRKEIPNVKIFLLCGSDLIGGFHDPKIWDPVKLKELIETFGLVIIERKDTLKLKAIEQEIFESDLLFSLRRNIFVIPQMVSNEISSSKLRLLIKRGQSIKYLTSDEVVEYIRDNNLYR